MAGVKRIYGATSLTGGVTGSLDNIDYSVLSFGDLAIAQGESDVYTGHSTTIDADKIYFYRYADVGSAEDSPRIIAPDNVGGGNGRWLLISPSYFMEDVEVDPGKKVITNEIQGNDSDLTIAYNDGTVHITVGASNTTFALPVTFSDQITSSVVTGTAPFVIGSNTFVANLNTQYVGDIGGSMTDYAGIVITDGTHSLTGAINGVSTDFDVIAGDLDGELATKPYVDWLHDQPNEISHTDLEAASLLVDDHPQYSLVDGTRAFTGKVQGITTAVTDVDATLTTKDYVDAQILELATNVHIRKDASIPFTATPRVTDHTVQLVTQNYHLATKYYVDNITGTWIDHGALSGLGDDDHNIYVLADGTRPFTNPVAGVTPVGVADLVTKAYADAITAASDLNFVKKDGTTPFTGVQNGVSSSFTSTPGDLDGELATVLYVNSIALGGGIDHGNLLASSLLDDDHTQYVLADGTRQITGEILGTTTTDGSANGVLTTKGYMISKLNDGTVLHNNLDAASLLLDTHTQYILADSSRAFDNSTNYPRVSNSGIDPSSPEHLATKSYVDAGLSGLGDTELVEYVDIYGRHSMIADQGFLPRLITDPLLTDIYDGQRLVTKFYVDTYTPQVRVSNTGDEVYGYLSEKFQFSDTPTPTLLDAGANTGIRYDTTIEQAGSIARAIINNTGSGFFVYRPLSFGVGAYTPQTYLDATNSGIFNAAGVSGNDLTETFIQPISDTNPGAGDADVRIEYVLGDVEYIEIVDNGGGTLTGGDGVYTFDIIGDTPAANRATWSVQMTSGSIVSVSRVSIGSGYTNVGTNDITSISGITGTFVLRPYVVGEIINISSYEGSGGDGYTSASYNITGTTVAGFNVSGHGTSGGTDVGALDITFYNPDNQKLKLSQYNPTLVTTPAHFPSYASGYTRTAGKVISSMSFDEWGNVTEILEEGTGQLPWTLRTASVASPSVDLALAYGNAYFYDPNGAARVIGIPDFDTPPVIGDTIIIDNHTGDAATYNITIYGQSGAATYATGQLTVEGVASQDIVIDVSSARTILTYVSAGYGWRIKVY